MRELDKVICVRLDIRGSKAVVSYVNSSGELSTFYHLDESGARSSSGDVVVQKDRALVRSRALGVTFALANHDLVEQVLNARAAGAEYDKAPGEATA